MVVSGEGVRPRGVLASMPTSFLIDTREAGLADLDVVIQVCQLPVCRVSHAASRNLLHVLLLMLLLQSMLLFKFCYYLVWLSFGNLVFYI